MDVVLFALVTHASTIALFLASVLVVTTIHEWGHALLGTLVGREVKYIRVCYAGWRFGTGVTAFKDNPHDTIEQKFMSVLGGPVIFFPVFVAMYFVDDGFIREFAKLALILTFNSTLPIVLSDGGILLQLSLLHRFPTGNTVTLLPVLAVVSGIIVYVLADVVIGTYVAIGIVLLLSKYALYKKYLYWSAIYDGIFGLVTRSTPKRLPLKYALLYLCFFTFLLGSVIRFKPEEGLYLSGYYTQLYGWVETLLTGGEIFGR